MIFQNPRAALNPIRPVGKQIEDVLLRHGLAAVKQRVTGRLRKLVKIVDPEMRYGSYPFELSEACASALCALCLQSASIDRYEPTTGLDVTTQKATMDLVRELTRERNMAVVRY